MKTVLVVDDQPDARYIMTRPLEGAGFDVRDTATGRDALRLAQLPVDLIVLDLVLKDMSGFDVLKQLKEHPATKNIPIILKTAVHLSDADRQRGLHAGAAAYFTEPFDPHALVSAVSRLLGSSRVDGRSSM